VADAEGQLPVGQLLEPRLRIEPKVAAMQHCPIQYC
jgi:hypothetical protein